jgi:hypothetical protein
LPKSWPDHLDDVVHALNHRLLLALTFSPKELLLGLIINTPTTDIEDNTSTLWTSDVLTQIAYVEQQRLDGYDEMVRHAIKRKAGFDKKLLQRALGEVIFKAGQLVQVYQNDLDYTFKTEHKLIPKWSTPCQIQARILNSYKLETLNGIPLQGEFSARRIRAFIPRQGTQLAKDQEEYKNGARHENNREGESREEAQREQQQEQREDSREDDETEDEEAEDNEMEDKDEDIRAE